MKLINIYSEEAFIEEALVKIKALCKKKKSKVNIGLSGGNTPLPFYKQLGNNSQLIKNHINFFLVDERNVPTSDSASNYGKITHLLGDFLHFETNLSIDKTLKKYEEKLNKITPDLIILGIGEDGHYASIFPNTKALSGKKAVYHTTTKEFEIKDRLTLSSSFILKSKEILVLIKDKDSVISNLKNPKLTIKSFPAKGLLKHPKLTILHYTTKKHEPIKQQRKSKNSK